MEVEVNEDRVEKEGRCNGARVIEQRLKMVKASEEQMIEVMDKLQGGCIYFGLIRGQIGERAMEARRDVGHTHTMIALRQRRPGVGSWRGRRGGKRLIWGSMGTCGSG